MSSANLLDGYTVVDLTHVLAGPSATRIMAEMGAEVIKVELPPLGDISRSLPFIKDGRSAYYSQQNRGKKSICINAKSEEGKTIIRDLIGKADVFIENFAPGVIGRLGFDWQAVHALNPRTVMCSISAFGQEGPLSALPGFDYIAQAYSGIMGMIGEADAAPYFPMAGIGDVMTGMHAAAAIGFALLHRERSGKGQYLDISLLDSYTHCHELNIQLYSMTNGETEPTRCGKHHYAVCPLGLFNGKDHYMCIITLEPQWPNLCRAMDRADLITDPRYDTNEKRIACSDEVIGIVQAWLDTMPSDEAILAKLNEHRVPCAPVQKISEVVADPHLLQRGTIRTISDPKLGEVLMPGMPLRFSEFEHNINLESASLGEHNEAILGGLLGYSEERLATLKSSGAIHANPNT